MKTLSEIVPKVLTGVQAQQTPGALPNTAEKIERSRKLFMSRTRYQRPTPEHQRVFEAAAKFASELNHKREPYWLCLLGPSGIGKTHLAREIYRHFMDYSRFEIGYDSERNQITGNTGQFCDWRKLCADLRTGAFGRMDDLEQDWFVVLDDIGSEYDPSGFIASAVDRIINSRSKTGRQKWTVVTCNLLLEQIGEIDPRIADRMLRNDSIVIESDLRSYSLP